MYIGGSMPKVSIIIPVYNVEKYIDRCMKSVLEQSLSDIEIILINDGSTDNCPTICDNYAKKDSRIKVIHKENQGLGFARNSGLDIATGKYIAFLDSDDYVDTNTYKRVYEELERAQAQMCIFSYIDKKDSGEEIKQIIPIGNTTLTKKDIVSVGLLGMIGSEPEYFNDTYIGMSVWKCVYSREVIEEHKIRFKSEKEFISEDIIFQMLIMPYINRIITLEDTLYYYCENAGSMSLTKKYSEDKFERYKTLYLKELDMLAALNIKDEGQIRATRMFLGNIRVCIKQIANNQSLDKRRKKDLISEICEDKIVNEIYHWYPFKKNPWKQRIVSLFIKLRLINCLLSVAKRS